MRTLKKLSRLFLFSTIMFSFSSASPEIINIVRNITNKTSIKTNDAREIKLTFDANGGKLKGYNSSIITSDTQFQHVPNKPTAERDNQKCEEWYYFNGSEKVIAKNDTTFGADTTLYANWKFYDVTVDASPGKFSDGTTTKTFNNKTSYHLEDFGTSICEGKIFDYYSCDGDRVVFPFKPSSNCNLKVVYANTPKVSIAAYAGDGTFKENAKMIYREFDVGSTWSSVKSQLSTPIIEGEKVFTEWKLNGQSISDDYTLTSSIFVNASYADAMKITFVANGGTFEDGATEKESALIPISSTNKFSTFASSAYSIAPKLKDDTGTYDLLGWFDNDKATGNAIPDTQEITQTKSFKVYACYKKLYKINITGESAKFQVVEGQNPFMRKDTINVKFKSEPGYGITTKNISVSWAGQTKVIDRDYEFKSTAAGWILKITDAPACDINVELKPDTLSYRVTANIIEGVKTAKINSFECTSLDVQYNTTCTIEGIPDNGYKITRINVKNKAGGEVKTITGSSGSFEMPYEDCVVNFDVETKQYKVNCSGDTNISSISARGGEYHNYKSEVTIDAVAKVGYQVEKIILEYEGTKEEIGNTFTMPACDVAVKASSTNKICTITWRNCDGSLLDETECKFGETPVYPHENPTYKDESHDYKFKGWSPELGAVSGDTEYTATYDITDKTYKIYFENYDHTPLKSYSVKYNVTPSYDGPTPTRPSTQQYDYTWPGAVDGWNKTIVPATKDATYIAKFTNTLRKYTVRFLNENGSEIYQNESLSYGTTPEYKGLTPVKESSPTEDYVFTGWSPTISVVTGNADYKATFKAVTKSFTITFRNDDGTILQTSKETIHTTPTYDGPTPTKEDPIGGYSYVFKGWSPSISEVTKDAEYTAEYTESANEFLLAFDNNGGHIKEKGYVVNTKKVAYGTKILDYLKTNSIVATHDYALYLGWEINGVTVDENTTMPAKTSTLKAIWKTYTVHLLGENTTQQPSEYVGGVLEVYSDVFNSCKPIEGYVFDHYEYRAGSKESIEQVEWKTTSLPFRPCSLNIPSDAYIQLKKVCIKEPVLITLFLAAGGGYYFHDYYVSETMSVETGWTFSKSKMPDVYKSNVVVDRDLIKWVDDNGNEISEGQPFTQSIFLKVVVK